MVIEFFMEWMKDTCPTFEERYDRIYSLTDCLNEYLDKKNPKFFIRRAFYWGETEEGFDYWNRAHIEWVDNYKEEFRGEEEK